MKKKIVLMFLLWPVMLLAQVKQKQQLKWNTIASVGLATGESNTKPVFQLSGGVNYNRFFTGIGVGYDPYEFNSVPVFADWRMKVFKKQAAFVYANGGYNFPGKYKIDNDFSKTADRIKGGLYTDIGIGYRVPLGSLHRLALSAGFSQKNITQRKVFVFPCLTGDCPDDIREYKYSFNRIVAKLSWEIGSR
ncbi:hypothetical protein [Terrimonas alba]|uniref:hypothetical protein n=1 Tax=Terrimonas alba TaxID=3349636 RepID=UPI0035F340C8